MSTIGEIKLQQDVPWRVSTSGKPIPKIQQSPVLRIPQTPYSNYAISVMKHPNPIASGLGKEAIVEAAGPDCVVPGQTGPIKLLGVKVWPIDIDLNFMRPVGQQFKNIGKVVDSALNLVDSTFPDH